MANPIVEHLRKTNTVPTVRAFIELSYAFDGHETVDDLERAELVEDLSEIVNLVRDGELIDTEDEFGENTSLLEELGAL